MKEAKFLTPSRISPWPSATHDDFLKSFKSYFTSEEIEFTRKNVTYIGRSRFSTAMVVAFTDEPKSLIELHFTQVIKVEREVVLRRFLQSLCTKSIDNYVIVSRFQEFKTKELDFTIQKCIENNLLEPVLNIIRGYPRDEYPKMQRIVKNDSKNCVSITSGNELMKFYYEKPPDYEIFPRGPYYENVSYYSH